jgi:fructose-specific phosphotransferase system IIC component
MTKFIDIDGKEYTTASFVVAAVVLLIGSVILGGAVAALITFVASVESAAWVWGAIVVSTSLWTTWGLRIVWKRSLKVKG